MKSYFIKGDYLLTLGERLPQIDDHQAGFFVPVGLEAERLFGNRAVVAQEADRRVPIREKASASFSLAESGFSPIRFSFASK